MLESKGRVEIVIFYNLLLRLKFSQFPLVISCTSEMNATGKSDLFTLERSENGVTL